MKHIETSRGVTYLIKTLGLLDDGTEGETYVNAYLFFTPLFFTINISQVNQALIEYLEIFECESVDLISQELFISSC